MAARHKKPRRPPAEQRGSQATNANPIEEELLASYLAGTLSADERVRVARYLADNPDAREVLSMAYSAMIGERRPK